MPSEYVKTPGGVFVPGEQYTYESSEIFLSMVQAEYQSEKDRASMLDSKLGISIPVISAYFFLIVQDNSVKDLLLSVLSAQCSIKEIFMAILYCATALTALCSLFFTVRAVMTRSYTALDMGVFYTAKDMSRPKEQFLAIIAKNYLLAVERNRSQNNRKAKEYQSGWVFGIISLSCFFLYTFTAYQD